MSKRPKTRRSKISWPKTYLANITEPIPKAKVLYSLNNEHSQFFEQSQFTVHIISIPIKKNFQKIKIFFEIHLSLP